MSIIFKGDISVARLDGMANNPAGLTFRCYDSGALKDNTRINHGDFVSWDGTKWVLRPDLSYLLDDSENSIQDQIDDITDLIPDGTTTENQLVNAADLSAVEERVTTAEGDIDSIEGKIPSGASSSNKLVTESDLEVAQDSWQSGFTPKGEATVSQIDALTTQSNGDQYIVTDSGTITAGTLAVTAGDTVAWDSTNEVWYKVNQYAKASAVSALQTDVTSISESIGPLAKASEFMPLPVDTYEQGNIATSDGLESPATNRIRSSFIACPYKKIVITASPKYKYRLAFYTKELSDATFTYIDTPSNKTFKTYSNVFEVPSNAVAFRVVFANEDDSDLVPANVDLMIFGKKDFNGFCRNLMPGSSNICVSTTRLLSVPHEVKCNQNKVIVEVDAGYKWRLCAYSDICCLINYNVSTDTSNTTWQTGNKIVPLPSTARYYIVSLAKSDDSDIDVSDSVHVRWALSFEDIVKWHSLNPCMGIFANFEKVNEIPFIFEQRTGYIVSGRVSNVYKTLAVRPGEGMACKVIWIAQNAAGGNPTTIEETDWTADYLLATAPSGATSFRIGLKYLDDSEIAPEDAVADVFGELVSVGGFAQGLLNSAAESVVSTTRLHSKAFILGHSQKFNIRCDSGYKWRVVFYINSCTANNDSVLQRDTYATTWQTGYAEIDVVEGALLAVVSLAKADDSAIDVSESSHVKFGCFVPGDSRFVGKRLSILASSSFTFGGSTSDPDSSRYAVEGDPTYPGNRCRYPQTGLLTNVNNTCWMKLINNLGMVLGINESWAGSRITNTSETDTGDVGPNRCISSQTRINHLDDNGTPDYILVYAGVNDIGNNVTLGTFNYDSPVNYTDEQIAALDVTTFADAWRALFIRLQKTYKSSKVIVLLPDYTTSYYTPEKADQYCEVIKEACDYFGVPYIDSRTSGITMFNSSTYLPDGIHCNAAGMDLIYEKLKRGFEQFM